jgi:RimJ/RimL family protein N-acetyltransferase
MKLNTERLIIQPLELKHAEAFFNYRSDAETNKYQGWIPYALEDCLHFIKNKVAKEMNQPNTWYQFIVLKKDNEEVIGDIGIHFLDPEGKQVEIGCTFAKQHHGNGYANEAMQEIIDYLFYKLDKHRIIGSIDPNNQASEKTLLRLGFRKEAHFKESIYSNGKWYDDVIYAVLKKEWKKRL